MDQTTLTLKTDAVYSSRWSEGEQGYPDPRLLILPDSVSLQMGLTPQFFQNCHSAAFPNAGQTWTLRQTNPDFLYQEALSLG